MRKMFVNDKNEIFKGATKSLKKLKVFKKMPKNIYDP